MALMAAAMAAAMGHEGGLLLLVVAGFAPIAIYRSFDEVLCGWVFIPEYFVFPEYLIFLVLASCADN
jgi:hypothetical protein